MKWMTMWYTGLMKDERGFGTLELVLLVCVLIGLALLFKDTVVDFVTDLLSKISSQGAAFDPGTIG